jgi:hypothetical protein
MIVAATTAIHLSQLSRVVVQESSRQADLVARQIYAQTSRALSRAPGAAPLEALRGDRDLRSLLDASVGYSPYLLFALIADRAGQTILHTERGQEDAPAAVYPRLTELINLDPVSRFSALYQGGRIYETTLPLLLDNVPFASIRLGVSATLLRQELTAAIKRSMILAGVALPLAWLAAMGLAHLILRPSGSWRARWIAFAAANSRRGRASPAATSFKSCPPSSSASGTSCRPIGSRPWAGVSISSTSWISSRTA